MHKLRRYIQRDPAKLKRGDTVKIAQRTFQVVEVVDKGYKVVELHYNQDGGFQRSKKEPFYIAGLQPTNLPDEEVAELTSIGTVHGGGAVRSNRDVSFWFDDERVARDEEQRDEDNDVEIVDAVDDRDDNKEDVEMEQERDQEATLSVPLSKHSALQSMVQSETTRTVRMSQSPSAPSVLDSERTMTLTEEISNADAADRARVDAEEDADAENQPSTLDMDAIDDELRRGDGDPGNASQAAVSLQSTLDFDVQSESATLDLEVAAESFDELGRESRDDGSRRVDRVEREEDDEKGGELDGDRRVVVAPADESGSDDSEQENDGESTSPSASSEQQQQDADAVSSEPVEAVDAPAEMEVVQHPLIVGDDEHLPLPAERRRPARRKQRSRVRVAPPNPYRRSKYVNEKRVEDQSRAARAQRRDAARAAKHQLDEEKGFRAEDREHGPRQRRRLEHGREEHIMLQQPVFSDGSFSNPGG